jgi:hypothetical protein
MKAKAIVSPATKISLRCGQHPIKTATPASA